MSYIEEKVEHLIQLKADFFPMTVIKLMDVNLDRIQSALENSIAKAPKYLVNAPVIIDVSDIPRDKQHHLDLSLLIALLQEKDIMPAGIRGLEKEHHDAALHLKLPLMVNGRSPNLAEGNPIASQQPKKEELPAPVALTTKIISRPVRAGTQVYAKNGDLLILSAVNAGAECLADGNIHIYGPLRGRALAGASGNKDAHIFCESLEAELIAIAGCYLTQDQIKSSKIKEPLIHIYLKDDKLQIEGI